MRKRDRDPFFTERSEDRKPQIGRDFFIERGFGHPTQKRELEARVAEFLEAHQGRRIFEHLGMFVRDIDQRFTNEIDIAVVGDAHMHAHAQTRTRDGLIDDASGDELHVWNEQRHFIAREDASCAQTDIDDRSADIADLNLVAFFHRAFEEHDDPGDEVRRDVLQAQPDADEEPRRTGDERVDVHADGVERDGEAQEHEHVPRDLSDRRGDAVRLPVSRQSFANGEADDLRRGTKRKKDEEPDEDRREGHGGAGQRDERVLDDFFDTRGQVHDANASCFADGTQAPRASFQPEQHR